MCKKRCFWRGKSCKILYSLYTHQCSWQWLGSIWGSFQRSRTGGSLFDIRGQWSCQCSRVQFGSWGKCRGIGTKSRGGCIRGIEWRRCRLCSWKGTFCTGRFRENIRIGIVGIHTSCIQYSLMCHKTCIRQRPGKPHLGMHMHSHHTRTLPCIQSQYSSSRYLTAQTQSRSQYTWQGCTSNN